MPKKKTSPSDYPQAVIQQIELLAQNIVIARKRRHETQAQWAKKLGVSQPTMARIERGDPAVAMASYVMCMWLINPACGLADLIAPQSDHASLEREIAKVHPSGAVLVSAAATKTRVSPAKQLVSQLGGNTAAELAAQFGMSPAKQLVSQLGGKSAAELASQLESNSARKLASQLGGKSAADLAAQLGIGSTETENTKVAAGLAALLAKAKPKSK